MSLYRNYWWSQISRYIRQHISICDLCFRTKPIKQALIGELHPLQIPDSWWDMLSVDFIVELPLSSGHDIVMTVVDSVLKWVSQMVIYYLWWVLWYFKEFKNAKLDKWQKMLLSLRSNSQTMGPYIQKSDSLCTRTDHHMLLPIVLYMVVPLYLK